MRITHLQINRYKSIQEPFYLDNLGKLHIFIGSNNAGKTNILDAIDQLCHNNTLRLKDEAADISVSFSLEDENKSELTVKQKGDDKQYFLNAQKIKINEAENILQSHIVRLSATEPRDPKLLEKDYDYLVQREPKLFKIFQNTLSRYLPQIKLTPDFLAKKLVYEGKNIRSFERLGAGFQQVFTILLYLFHPIYTILLLEEPEIHLHPALVKKLLKVIEEENLYNQVFLTTHSTIFIHPQNLHRLFRVVGDNGSTKIYSPRLSGKKINYERLTQELNADNCEMFFADKVLLVEGPSDHILMRGLIDRFYQGEKDIKVIQVYGKSNIDVYADILDMFNIPYAVLLDLDAIYDTGIKLLHKNTELDFAEAENTIIDRLKASNIFVLPNGSIEKNYPHYYQRHHKHKTQNALFASAHISQAEYQSPTMKYLKQVIDCL